ncbi:hypothetical protein I7I49_24390 [Sinorhizobium meliloti]|uniref:hypothetical protein n=1 Tax=Rhizobium meliloti TaxID=382 RepID=UPI00237F834F|nr:hypothetical protein [Sinorhizobium meliloti]MDE3813320.1 hypothetical protein [Sinorhizobium meliloti]
MGDQQNCKAGLFDDLLQERNDVLLADRVEARGGLVGKEEGRIANSEAIRPLIPK